MISNEQIVRGLISRWAGIVHDRTGGWAAHWWEHAKPILPCSDDNLAGILNSRFGEVPGFELQTTLNNRLSFMTDADLEPRFAWEILKRRFGERDAVDFIRPGNDYLSSERQTVARNIRVEQLYVQRAIMMGRQIGLCDREEVHRCYTKRSPGELRLQLQAKYKDGLRCVHVVLWQDGDNVSARVDWAAQTTPDRDIGYDFESEESMSHDDHNVPIATAANHEGFGIVQFRCDLLPSLDEREMPIVVYDGGNGGLWSATGYMDCNRENMKVDMSCSDAGCSTDCIKIECSAEGDGVGLCWRNPDYDWGDRPGGANLATAKTLYFFARGEKGGENVKFFMGGIMDKMVCDTADRSMDVELTNRWKLYEMDLGGLDLTCVKTGFGFRILGQRRPVTFYLDLIYYDKASDLIRAEGDRVRHFLFRRADLNDPVAQYILGVRAEKGIDFTPDVKTAKRWYLKAASSGEPSAIAALKRLL